MRSVSNASGPRSIAGGVNSLWQIIARPILSPVPYATSDPNVFICSSSTPPGGGVHGMCGYHAAMAVLRRRFGIKVKVQNEATKVMK